MSTEKYSNEHAMTGRSRASASFAEIVAGAGEYVQLGGRRYKKLFDRIHCADGFHFSAQANENCYCNPRADEGPYTAVELGYPSAEPPEYIKAYAEDHNYTETVYGFVPVELVLQMIADHGGEKENQ